MRAVSRWSVCLWACWSHEGELGTQDSKDEPSAGPQLAIALAMQNRLSESPQGGAAFVLQTTKGEHGTK